jgi:TetR/AcrR family transcriptional regulator
LIKELFNCDKAGRMTGDERRGQIISTAVDLFSKYGFSGTTTKKIAEAAGVSEAMVFRHFASKDELYQAILHNKVCEGGEHQFPWQGDPALIASMDRGDDLEVFYLLAIRALEKHQADERFMRLVFYSALEEHELGLSFVHDLIANLYEFIGGYIRRRQAEGAMRDIDPKIAIRAFMGMLIHHSLNNILWDRDRKLLDISNESAAKNFAEILVRGISNNN